MASELTSQNKNLPPAVCAAPETASPCVKAHELLEKGDYQEAAVALGELWQGVGVRPDLSLYNAPEQAQILLIVGALTGWLGSAQQSANAQEQAKNLLSESAALFEKLGERDKWGRAQCELGVCYWRAGAFEEARIIYDDALEHALDLWPGTEWKLTHGLALVETFSHNYRYAERLLKQAEYLIAALENDVLRGNLYFHRALAQRRISEEESLDKYLHLALETYEKAGFYYERAQNALSCAAVANNVGYVMCKLGRFDEAHCYIDAALEIYLAADEKCRAASTYDTKAQVYLAESRFGLAEQAAMASVELLRAGDEAALLAESLTTLGTIYARRRASLRARRTFENAAKVAQQAGDKGGAGAALLAWLEELQGELPRLEFAEVYRRAEELLGRSPRLSVQRRLRELAQKLDHNSRDININLPAAPVSPQRASAPEPEIGADFSLPAAVNEFEARHIVRALNASNGSVTKAAQILGISHQNLSLQLKTRHSNLITSKKSHRKKPSKATANLFS